MNKTDEKKLRKIDFSFMKNKENILLLAMFIISIIVALILANIKINYNKIPIITCIIFFALLINMLLNLTYNLIKNNSRKVFIKNIIKYLFSVVITIFLSNIAEDKKYIIYGLINILFIYCVTEGILKKYKKISNIINDILFLLYNIQIFVFIFGNSFINMNMLLNVNSIKGIGGNLILYGITFIVVFIISCLSIKNVELSNKINLIIIIEFLIVCLLAYNTNLSLNYSPLGNYKLLIDEYCKYREEMKYFKSIDVNAEEYYKKDVENYYVKNENLPEDVNIILIFTEGLSQHIIDDERNILPNIKECQNKSLNFTNYYNHTFATYKGIIGQLYSGFNYTNNDINKLPSIQSILKDNGYKTEFLNSEPKNNTFLSYLKSFGFTKTFNDWDEEEIDGISKEVVSDRTMYKKILEKANEYNQNGDKFLLSMYTYGTHLTLDGVETNGNNKIINKFSYLDKSFGEFIKEFEKSPIYENTIIIFTTDHATYTDLEFKETFPNYEKTLQSFDKIPLFIYHKNVVAQNIDVKERTSINLAPTILDYLDIGGENYFLGESLFSNYDNELDRMYYDGSIFKIKDGIITNETENSAIKEKIIKYISIFKNNL